MEQNIVISLGSSMFRPDEILGGDVESGNLNIRLGKRPKIQNLRKLYELGNKELPPELEVFDDYGIWIITNTVGIVDEMEGGNDSVKHLGFKVRFNEDDPYSIIDVLPKSRFVKLIGGEFVAEADLNALGEFGASMKNVGLTDVGFPVGLGAEGKLSVSVGTTARLSLNVITPKITAIGEEDIMGQWQFTKDEQPLLGMQKMVMTVLTPPYEEVENEELVFEAQVTASIKESFFKFPDKRASEWVQLKCAMK